MKLHATLKFASLIFVGGVAATPVARADTGAAVSATTPIAQLTSGNPATIQGVVVELRGSGEFVVADQTGRMLVESAAGVALPTPEVGEKVTIWGHVEADDSSPKALALVATEVVSGDEAEGVTSSR